MKYYFENSLGDELCYTKEHFFDLMEERGISEIKVYPAIIMFRSGYFYCQEHGETFESGVGDCGKYCDYYKPRNGKNGRCKHHSNCYEPADESITINIKDKWYGKRNMDSDYYRSDDIFNGATRYYSMSEKEN